MGIWIELGVFVLALAFGLWQIHDVKKAQKRTAQERASKAEQAANAQPEAAPGSSAGSQSSPNGKQEV